MTKRWHVQNVSKDDMDNFTSTTKLERELNRLSADGWSVHTILDDYSAKSDGRKHVTIICYKEIEKSSKV